MTTFDRILDWMTAGSCWRIFWACWLAVLVWNAIITAAWHLCNGRDAAVIFLMASAGEGVGLLLLTWFNIWMDRSR